MTANRAQAPGFSRGEDVNGHDKGCQCEPDEADDPFWWVAWVKLTERIDKQLDRLEELAGTRPPPGASVVASDAKDVTPRHVMLLNEHPAYDPESRTLVCPVCPERHRRIADWNADFYGHAPSTEQVQEWAAGSPPAPGEAVAAVAKPPRVSTFVAVGVMTLGGLVSAPMWLLLVVPVALVGYQTWPLLREQGWRWPSTTKTTEAA